MRVGVAEHPAAAVHVEDHWQRPDGVRGPDDPHAHVADVGRHGDPAVVHGRLVDRRGLQLVEHGARLGRAQLVQERRPGGRLDDRLRGRLEHDRVVRGYGHVRLPSRVVGGERVLLGGQRRGLHGVAGRLRLTSRGMRGRRRRTAPGTGSGIRGRRPDRSAAGRSGGVQRAGGCSGCASSCRCRRWQRTSAA